MGRRVQLRSAPSSTSKREKEKDAIVMYRKADHFDQITLFIKHLISLYREFRKVKANVNVNAQQIMLFLDQSFLSSVQIRFILQQRFHSK